MKTSKKELYQAPAVTVVEVKTEGIVCQSPGHYNKPGYGNADEI